MDKISLNASMRSNLLSLQNISKSVSHTQNKLSTGLKVNSAIDNPSSYYTARSLSNRASDLSALLDSMSQAVQTIKAATTGLETGAELLAQASAVAIQALENGKVADFSDYTKITADMDTATIQGLLTEGAKLVLAEDINIDSSLMITNKNITIDGNGHKITFGGTRAAAIHIDGGSADIKNLNINATGTKVYGIRVTNKGSLNIDNAQGIKVNGSGAQKIVNGDPELYDGKSNTTTILAEDGSATAAKLASEYQAYEGDPGEWYLPSIGELMQLFNTDVDNINSSFANDATDVAYKEIIDAAIDQVGGNELDGWYWSSSEFFGSAAWVFDAGNGERSATYKQDKGNIRAFQLFENHFDPMKILADNRPQVGDIMHKDGSWISVDDYSEQANNPAIGVITNVSETGDVKIVALNNIGDGEDPFSVNSVDISGITEYEVSNFMSAIKSEGIIKINNSPFKYSNDPEKMKLLSNLNNQYMEIINQYNLLIKDSGYKGVNLISNDTLNVRFNENSSSSLNVSGKDMSATTIGINTFNWIATGGAAQSLKELSGALNQIRSFQSELGNSYSIITNRQKFTESLVNVLSEGADKLTLADMNEESANMLALQTRQQLAVNALSLASQTSQGILKLF